MLFPIWAIWIWWLALIIALLLIWIGYRSALQAADVYGQLLEATFDVHRHLLYGAFHQTLPETSIEEKTRGEKLTYDLWYGPLYDLEADKN